MLYSPLQSNALYELYSGIVLYHSISYHADVIQLEYGNTCVFLFGTASASIVNEELTHETETDWPD